MLNGTNGMINSMRTHQEVVVSIYSDTDEKIIL
jgi:hypothetical protein